MCRPLPPTAILVLGAVFTLASVGTALAQEPQRADTLAPADTTAPDTLATPFAQVGNDPRLTWLGDTLGVADSILPKFSDLPEVWPDSVLDIYTLARPGAGPAWTLTGTALTARGAYNLLDVLESEFPVLAQDLGGSGLGVYLGSPAGTGTNVQVVIDGVPAGNALFASRDLRQIPLEAVARVAWYPGPQAAAWGGAATGGVLAITTRRSLMPTARSMIAFLMGSFDAQAFSGYFGRPVTSRGDLFLGANFDAIDGFNRSGDFTRNQTLVRAGWRIGRRQRIEVARLGDGLSGRDSRVSTNALSLTGQEDVNAAAVHGFYTGGVGPVTARFHAQRETRDVGAAFQYGTTQGIVGEGRTTDVRGSLEGRVGERLVAWAAGGWTREEAFSRATVFLADTASFLDEGFGLVPRETTEWGGGAGYGGPADPLAANLAVRSFSFGGGAGRELAWQAEALARPGWGVTLRAAAGHAARRPDFVGQALLARLAAAGAEIHPGIAADPEAVERWTDWRAEASWAGDPWRLAVRAWRATGDGAFLWLPPTAWTRFDPTESRLGEAGFNTFDVLDLTVTGLEGDVTLPLPYGVQGRLRARWLDDVADDLGAQVPYVPEFQALGQLRYARRFFPSRDLLLETRLSGRFVGDRRTLSATTLPARLVGDLLVEVTIVHVTLFVSLKNVTSQEFRTEDGFALAGYEGFLGINWRFRE